MARSMAEASSKTSRMVSLDEARDLVLAGLSALPTEAIALTEALGRVIAEDIVADEDLVGYARSAMDGYALRAADIEGAKGERPARLPVVGKVLAEKGEASLPPGAAIAITTGAPVPHGADVVVPYEQVERIGNEILLSVPAQPGNCIFPPAEDVRRGEKLVSRGEALRAATLGLLAFIGRGRVAVYRRPRVSVVSTGSELVGVEAKPAHGQVRNSNGIALAALAQECGATAQFCGTAPDNRQVLRQLLESARRGADLLVTTGGASVGERDLVKGLLAEMGAEFRFRQVAMRPGKPIGCGTWNGVPVCVLPGNPAAAFVGFQEFVRPALLRLAGRTEISLPAVRATLRGRVKSKAGLRYVILARATVGGDGFEVAPLENQCSVLVRTSADANALIVLPEGPITFETGDTVDVQVLDWNRVVNASENSQVSSGAPTCVRSFTP